MVPQGGPAAVPGQAVMHRRSTLAREASGQTPTESLTGRAGVRLQAPRLLGLI